MTANAAGRHARAPGLGGTGWLADDLYLMAHDERTGRLVLSARAAGLGLAGALLAELVLAGCVGIAGGQVAVTGTGPPGDGLAAGVLGVLASERPPRPVADWLAFLARTAPADVAGRLEQAGYLVAVAARHGRGVARGGGQLIPTVRSRPSSGSTPRCQRRGPPMRKAWCWLAWPPRVVWAHALVCTCRQDRAPAWTRPPFISARTCGSWSPGPRLRSAPRCWPTASDPCRPLPRDDPPTS